MFRHSLARLVLVLQWTAILAVVGITFLLAGREWLAYADAGRIVGLTRADRVLFTATAGIRFENGVTGVAVLTLDDPAAAVEESYRKVDGYYRDAVLSVAEADFEGRDALLAAARDAHDTLADRRPMLDALLAQPLAERDMGAADPWLMAMYELAGRLADISVAATNAVRMLDPTVAELAYVRQSSYLIRERFGRPCSALRPDVQRNQPLDRDRIAAWREGIGAYRARWEALAEQLGRPGAPPQLVEDIRNGRAATEAAQERMDAIIYGLDGSGRAGDGAGRLVASLHRRLRPGAGARRSCACPGGRACRDAAGGGVADGDGDGGAVAGQPAARRPVDPCGPPPADGADAPDAGHHRPAVPAGVR